MLATLIDFSSFLRAGGSWIFERKFDGFRALAFRGGSTVRLLSRSGQDLGGKFPEIVAALKTQPVTDFIIDGEVVAYGAGQTSFQQLQKRLKPTTLDAAKKSGVRLVYFVFDLLFAAGHDTRALPLRSRKKLLKQLLEPSRVIRFTADRSADARKSFAAACRGGWEGLIAKDPDAPYVAGRSKQWLKLKCGNRQEFVIGGWTEPQGSRQAFGALLVGYYEHGVLKYAGKVGTGYSQKTLLSLGEAMKKIERPSAAFERDPALPRRNVRWAEPQLVAEVAFTEWTSDGKLRHPRFLGLRPDKSAEQVRRERPEKFS